MQMLFGSGGRNTMIGNVLLLCISWLAYEVLSESSVHATVELQNPRIGTMEEYLEAATDMEDFLSAQNSDGATDTTPLKFYPDLLGEVSAARQARSVAGSSVLLQRELEYGRAAPESPEDIWRPHHPTVKHLKQAGTGYVVGSPLFYLTDVSLSTSMKCVVHMLVLYFFVVSSAAILRTIYDLKLAKLNAKGVDPERKPNSMSLLTVQAAKNPIGLIPMLCVLFLAVRIRAIQLTQNMTERYDLPQPWLRFWMVVATAAVNVQLLLVFLYPMITGKLPDVDTEGNLVVGNLRDPRRGSTIGVKFILFLRLLCMVALYAGSIMVIYGSYTMKDDAKKAMDEIWGSKGPPEISPAVWSVEQMALLFFLVYTANMAFKIVDNFKYQAIFQLAISALLLAPMLCVLFLLARMRALQLDQKDGNPQRWCQKLFYVCVGAMWLQMLAIIGCGAFLGGESPSNQQEGDIKFKIGSPGMFSFLSSVRFFCLLAIYVSIIAITIGISLLKPRGGGNAPDPSNSLSCSMVLVYEYFGVHLGLYLITVHRQITGAASGLYVMKWFEAARNVVLFCPMLAILFTGIAIRARQLTNNKTDDYPTNGLFKIDCGWCMWLSTVGVTLQAILCIAIPLMTGRRSSDGKENRFGTAFKVVEVVRYTLMFTMYAATGACLVALFDPKIQPSGYQPNQKFGGMTLLEMIG